MLVQITIPQPKAKRLRGTGRLYVLGGSGWGGDSLLHNAPLAADHTDVTLSVPDVYRETLEHPRCDGHTLKATVRYRNANGSRTEEYRCPVRPAEAPHSS